MSGLLSVRDRIAMMNTSKAAPVAEKSTPETTSSFENPVRKAGSIADKIAALKAASDKPDTDNRRKSLSASSAPAADVSQESVAAAPSISTPVSAPKPLPESNAEVKVETKPVEDSESSTTPPADHRLSIKDRIAAMKSGTVPIITPATGTSSRPVSMSVRKSISVPISTVVPKLEEVPEESSASIKEEKLTQPEASIPAIVSVAPKPPPRPVPPPPPAAVAAVIPPNSQPTGKPTSDPPLQSAPAPAPAASATSVVSTPVANSTPEAAKVSESVDSTGKEESVQPTLGETERAVVSETKEIAKESQESTATTVASTDDTTSTSSSGSKANSIAAKIAALKQQQQKPAEPAAPLLAADTSKERRRMSTNMNNLAGKINLAGLMPGAPRPILPPRPPSVREDEEETGTSQSESTIPARNSASVADNGELKHLSLSRPSVNSVSRKRAVKSVKLAATWRDEVTSDDIIAMMSSSSATVTTSEDATATSTTTASI